MRILWRAEPVERRDFGVGHGIDRGDARANRAPVRDDGAGAALRHAAAELRPFQLEVVAQDIKKRRLRVHVNRMCTAVDLERKNAHRTLLKADYSGKSRISP